MQIECTRTDVYWVHCQLCGNDGPRIEDLAEVERQRAEHHRMHQDVQGPAGSAADEKPPTYHDLHITTAQIPRTSIFDLPYGLEITCTRVGGWELRDMNQMLRPGGLAPSRGVVVAGEYDEPEKWLVLDVAGHVILDSREVAAPGGEDQG